MDKTTRACLRIIPMIILVFIMDRGAEGQQLNTGLFGGVTASQVDGDSYSGFNKLGLTAGFFINSHIAYQIYWQAEIKYGTRGVYKGPSDNDLTLY
jgi:hypothetical protein